MVWGGLGGRGKIIRIDVCRVFIIWPIEKPGKPPKSFFEFLALLTRHRFFFFDPETLNCFFGENTKRRAPENGSKSVLSKDDFELSGAIWCQFGCQFSNPKAKNSS